MTTSTVPEARREETVERAAFAALLVLVASVQFSIFVAELALSLAIAGWIVLLALRRERPSAPAMFGPLVIYAAITFVAAILSLDPAGSLRDTKQLLLFLLVPLVYRLARGARTSILVWVIITTGAVSAILGVVQFGVLEYDFLGRRPLGTLGHYMTYSGLLMLVVVVALARVLFKRRDRTWPLLVMPALVVAIALTQTRSAWVGVSVAAGLLLLLKDFRLVALLPVAAALFFGLAPPQLTHRFYSIFDPQDPTSRDRISMLRAGARMVRDYPLTGVGPNDVQRLYPRYRDAAAVEPNQPHLHNVPLQIAAERGLPALAVWIWFVVTLATEGWRRFRANRVRVLAAALLGAVAAMLSAGLFEYNFGDSEFLMLFLVIVTLPFAAEHDQAGQA